MMEIAKVQVARGHKVILYSASESHTREDFGGIEIRSITCRRSKSYFRDIEYLSGALRELRDEHVDVCHFHSLPEGAALSGGVRGLKVLSYDYFIFRRGKNTPLFWWYRKALRKFSRLLPVSEYCRVGSQEYWGLESGRFRVMHNGVNLEQFCPEPARGLAKRIALNIGDERVILYVGRVCEQKGIDLLIDAYLRLKQEFPRVRLVVAGPADAFGKEGETNLTRRIAKAGGLYLGAVEERELSSIYNLADIFVMPTRSIEMFGMAAIEAQACGKPVVASRHGGLPEVISEKSGRFFKTGDYGALADQLSLLLRDQLLCSSLANAARENASRFSWSNIADQLDLTYSPS
jgi:glycosyltransferase involved in cell wall biosynthesis